MSDMREETYNFSANATIKISKNLELGAIRSADFKDQNKRLLFFLFFVAHSVARHPQICGLFRETPIQAAYNLGKFLIHHILVLKNDEWFKSSFHLSKSLKYWKELVREKQFSFGKKKGKEKYYSICKRCIITVMR